MTEFDVTTLRGVLDSGALVLQEQLAYWKSQLANAPSVHSLPLDRPRPAQQDYAD